VVITDANGHWGLAGLQAGLTQVTWLDQVAGCPSSVPMTAAVINYMTIAVNEVLTCNSF
jgi:hypothetical protein